MVAVGVVSGAKKGSGADFLDLEAVVNSDEEDEEDEGEDDTLYLHFCWSAPTPTPTPTPNPILSCFSSKIKRPSVRVTSEFDSLAKLKVSFNNDHKGEVSPPQVSFISQYLSIHYNFEDQSTLLNSCVDVGPRLQFRASHDLKAQQGEATMVAKLADPGYAF